MRTNKSEGTIGSGDLSQLATPGVVNEVDVLLDGGESVVEEVVVMAGPAQRTGRPGRLSGPSPKWGPAQVQL